MKKALKRFYVVTALVLTIGGMVALSLVHPLVGTQTDFSIYNTGWNGASDTARDLYGQGALLPAFSVSFTGGSAEVVHRSFVAVDPEPGTTSILILGPDTPPTPAESAWLGAFVRGGGRVVVADDFGSGNSFLEAIGAATRFDGRPLADLAYTQTPSLAVSTSFDQDHPLTGGLGEVVLNHATVLRPGTDASASVIAKTEASSWLDSNDNARKDEAEPKGPFPLLVIEPVGSGTVVVLSDPSLMVNGMRTMGDNEELTRRLVTWASQGERRVLVDESHREYTDPVGMTGTRIGELPQPWRLGLGFAGFALFLVVTLGAPLSWARRPVASLRSFLERRFPEPPREQTPDPLESVRRRHPGWSKSDLRDILLGWREDHGD